MTTLLICALALYAGVAILFVVMSLAELRASRRWNGLGVAGAVFAALFWPATLIVIAVMAAKLRRRDNRVVAAG